MCFPHLKSPCIWPPLPSLPSMSPFPSGNPHSVSCKVHLNIFFPSCLGEHCRVRLGTNSRWWNKREENVQSIYPASSGGQQFPSAWVLFTVPWSAVGGPRITGHGILTRDPVTWTGQRHIAPLYRWHCPRELPWAFMLLIKQTSVERRHVQAQSASVPGRKQNRSWLTMQPCGASVPASTNGVIIMPTLQGII